jgi:hypothetical protein
MKRSRLLGCLVSISLAALVTLCDPSAAQDTIPPPATQNPSPTVEHTRSHERASHVPFRTVAIVGFSAGHGAVRAIHRDPRHFAQVDAVLLLHGRHTSYVPGGPHWMQQLSEAR